jgi:hypothetical protein
MAEWELIESKHPRKVGKERKKEVRSLFTE